MQPTPEDYAHSRLIAYAAYQWPSYQAAAHHRLIARHLEAVERGDITRLMISMPPRHGKALKLDTPIPTPDGWTTIGELRVGDQVFDEDGTPCRVVAKSPIWRQREVFEVLSDDGDSIIADSEHAWLVRLCRKRPVFKLKTTRQLAERTSLRSPMIRKQGALRLPEAELPIPPYVLGVWLGDGHALDAAITQGHEDAAFIIRELADAGYEITDRAGRMLYGVLGLKAQLRLLGLVGNKHIPSCYLRASASQRLSLLQGLIDTDGHVAPDGQVEFTANDASLAAQVRELACSLGVKASLITGRATLDGRDVSAKYRVMFYMAHAARLPRKAERCRNGVKSPNRYITVEPAGLADTVCIQVDSPSHMFLCGRTMVPTHNSMLASEFFPAWYLGRNPSHYVIAATYAQELADDFGRKVRDQIGEASFQAIFPGCRLKGGSKSSKRFHVTQERPDILSTELDGAYFAAGIGGPLTGRGAHLLLIDDPVKNREEAESETIRRRNKDWYTSTAYTRLMPGAKAVIIQTRWHSDDLSGWQLREHAHEGWTVLSLPAVAESDGDLLGRHRGEPLWDNYPVDVLDRIRQSLGTRDWSALYQQRPAPAEGGIFKAEWFRRYAARRDDYLEIVQSWDTAYKPGQLNDPSVCTTWGIRPDGYDLLDVRSGRLEYPDLKARAIRMAEEWKPNAILIEDKASGQSLLQDLRRETTLPVIPIQPKGDKIFRASGVSATVEAGKVALPQQAPWLTDYETEMLTFPNAPNDDAVDSTSQFLEWVRLRAGPDRFRIRRL